jgi:thiol-disulfide isomerase/thioredoxin
LGATWCKPCAAAIPELSALARKYRDTITVISMFVMEGNQQLENKINPAYIDKVERYVAKRNDKMEYTIGVDGPDKSMEKNWITAAGKIGVPYLFVIDRQGIIAAIGSSVNDIRPIIDQVLAPDYRIQTLISINQQQGQTAVPFNPFELLLIDGNGGDEKDFLFRSLLTSYDGKIKSANPHYIEGFGWVKAGAKFESYKDRFQIIGVSLSELYYMAYADTLSNRIAFRGVDWQYADTLKEPWKKTSYGKFWHEPVLEVKDQSPFQVIRRSPANRFNYSLKVPNGFGTAATLQRVVRNDLNSYFGYAVTIQTRNMPYWKLYAPDKALAISKLKSKDQSKPFEARATEDPYIFTNALTRDIAQILGANYGYAPLDYGRLPRDQQGAFLDETGITEKIDFVMDRTLPFEQQREYLRTYGLELIKAYRPMKVVVIRDE